MQMIKIQYTQVKNANKCRTVAYLICKLLLDSGFTIVDTTNMKIAM